MRSRIVTARAARAVALALVAGTVAAPSAGASAGPGADGPTIVVQPHRAGPPVSPLLGGTNHRWNGDGEGMWDPRHDAPVAGIVEKSRAAGLSMVRYPGGTVANLFDWKEAIGPVADRACQRSGRADGRPLDSSYGVDEHMRYTEAIGAQAQLMVAFASETPQGAADWVEYMNAPVGTNPRGGVAWAQVRAENGHPEPYGVESWELGNEHDRAGNQRYWMSRTDVDLAREQYVFGGTQWQDPAAAGNVLGRGCDFTPQASVSTGAAAQQVDVRFPPVVPGTTVVSVDGEPWRETADLAAAGPDDRVFAVDDESGRITFGDGVHGAIPAAGSRLTAAYESGPHPGFVDFAAEMKKADPSIAVYSAWGDVGFVELMAEHGLTDAYDGVSVHPYTNFDRDFEKWSGYAEAYDQHMIGEKVQADRVAELVRAVEEAGSDAEVAVSEFGALYLGAPGAGPNESHTTAPNWSASMMHVIYMASQYASFVDHGISFAEGNDLTGVDSGAMSRTLFSRAPELLWTGEAELRNQLSDLFTGGGRAVAHHVVRNPVVAAAPTDLGSGYDALRTTAVLQDDGDLLVMVVNRDPRRAIHARVTVGDAYDGSVTATTLTAPEPSSVNAPGEPPVIVQEERTDDMGGGTSAQTFAPHSVTVLELTRG
jgi:alpha-L-arabinofuranosidase